MSLLGKYTEKKENRIRMSSQSDKEFLMPAVTREDKDDTISLKKCMIISAILHPAVIGVIWLILLICALLGINLSIFDKPQPKANDIEFVLVDKEDTPRDLNTKNSTTPITTDSPAIRGISIFFCIFVPPKVFECTVFSLLTVL